MSFNGTAEASLTNVEAFLKEYTELCSRYHLVFCLHCRKVHKVGAMKSRGLCKICYENEEIRNGYAFRNRGNWAEGSRVWDVLDKALLVDLLRNKLTDRQIAKQMNRTERAVSKMRRRLGIIREKYTGKLRWPVGLSNRKADE